MKKSVLFFLMGGIFICLPGQSACYAQEKDITVVIRQQASTRLTPELIQAQKELEMAELNRLHAKDRVEYYEALPDRQTTRGQNRIMTQEVQKACRGIERDYTLDIRFKSLEADITYWDFGDGKPPQLVHIPTRAGTLTTTYTYDVPGVYQVKVEFFTSGYVPTADEDKKIDVVVEACTAPVSPEIPVNPNIHKVIID